jgi:protein-S-isoprenylcysteine O-methyltransferase Ste14
MVPDFLLTVAAIWAIAAITPGPNFFFIVRCALTGSRRAAMSAVAGVVTGTLCWGLAGWLGVSALFMVRVEGERATCDLLHMSAGSRRHWLTQAIMQLFCVAVGMQLVGFDPLPLNLTAAADTAVRSLGLVLGMLAAMMMIWPRLVRDTWNGAMTPPDQVEGHELVTSGPYMYIRHPFYLSLLAGFAGIELTLASYLVFLIVPLFTAFVIVIIGKEERQLKAHYGDRYTAYAARSWRLVPLLY